MAGDDGAEADQENLPGTGDRQAGALDQYLIDGKPRAGAGSQIVSSFWAALGDARRATCRDIDTGASDDGECDGRWLGAIAYLCFIDQVGNAVRRPSCDPQPDTNAFRRALYNFASIEDPVADALYALRCSLAHNYSLTNSHGDARLRHVFSLYPDGGFLVELPATPWNGSFVGIPPDDSVKTKVNLRAVGDLGEAIATAILEAHSQGDLDVVANLDAVELVVRFGFQAQL